MFNPINAIHFRVSGKLVGKSIFLTKITVGSLCIEDPEVQEQ